MNKEKEVWRKTFGTIEVYVKKGSVFDRPQNLFYPWGNGCGLGVGQKTIKEAMEICLTYARVRNEGKMQQHIDGLVECRIALNALARQGETKP